MSRSIAKALRHGKLSEYRTTPEQHAKFMARVKELDMIVKDCQRKSV